MAKNSGPTVGGRNVNGGRRVSIRNLSNRDITAAIAFGGLSTRARQRLRRELSRRG